METIRTVKQALLGVGSKRRQNIILTVCIAVAFMVFDSFLLLTLNLKGVEERTRGNTQLEVYLMDEINPLQLHMLLQSIKNSREVEKIEYKSPRIALKQMEDFWGREIMQGVDPEIFPASLLLSLKTKHRGFDQVVRLAAKINSQEGVEDVEFGEVGLRKSEQTAHIFSLVIITFGIVIIIALSVLVFNLMRFRIRSQEEIIRTLILLGADLNSIAASMMIQGMLLGAGGSLMGILCLQVLLSIVSNRISNLAFLSVPTILGLIGGGMVLGALGMLIGTREHLRLQT